jgi:GH35 family endo-1,4-beta-xylanase
LELFNYATIDNNLKYEAWREGEKNAAKREQTLRAVQWIADKGLAQRGHTLVWWLQYGKWKIDLPREEVIELMRKHIADMTSHPVLNKTILDWDVLNEASHNSPIYNHIGKEAFIELFRIARQHHPNGLLFINDAKITSQRIPKHAHHEGFHYDLAKYLIDNGAPLDGIGFQGHHSGNIATDPSEVLRILNRFAALGKTLQITEFDIKTYNEGGNTYTQQEIDQLEADYTRDYMTICFSHPSVDAFIMWGFWDGNHWKDNAPIFRRDWSLKPSGQIYKDLVFGKWWTREKGASDAEGRFATRGFLGDYEITVTADGKTKMLKTSLPQNGQTLTVKLD